jgi:hypothetical protein
MGLVDGHIVLAAQWISRIIRPIVGRSLLLLIKIFETTHGVDLSRRMP